MPIVIWQFNVNILLPSRASNDKLTDIPSGCANKKGKENVIDISQVADDLFSHAKANYILKIHATISRVNSRCRFCTYMDGTSEWTKISSSFVYQLYLTICWSILILSSSKVHEARNMHYSSAKSQRHP